MTERGEVDLRALERLLDWHIGSGTNAIVVVGTTGESATLSCGALRAGRPLCVLRKSSDTGNCGNGSNNTHEALEFTSDAAKSGADAALW